MTCNQFCDLNETDEAMFAMTRGERAACCRHYNGCGCCRTWVLAQAWQLLPCDGADAEIARVAELLKSDNADPEYVETVIEK